jgi:gamma-glutamyl-gamma-aminobutyrate hydrolase PuuD
MWEHFGRSAKFYRIQTADRQVVVDREKWNLALFKKFLASNCPDFTVCREFHTVRNG